MADTEGKRKGGTERATKGTPGEKKEKKRTISVVACDCIEVRWPSMQAVTIPIQYQNFKDAAAVTYFSVTLLSLPFLFFFLAQRSLSFMEDVVEAQRPRLPPLPPVLFLLSGAYQIAMASALPCSGRRRRPRVVIGYRCFPSPIPSFIAVAHLALPHGDARWACTSLTWPGGRGGKGRKGSYVEATELTPGRGDTC